MLLTKIFAGITWALWLIAEPNGLMSRADQKYLVHTTFTCDAKKKSSKINYLKMLVCHECASLLPVTVDIDVSDVWTHSIICWGGWDKMWLRTLTLFGNAVNSGLICNHPLQMSAKKCEVDAEWRLINKSWTAKLFFTVVGAKAVCLVCDKHTCVVAVFKEHKLSCHFGTKRKQKRSNSYNKICSWQK